MEQENLSTEEKLQLQKRLSGLKKINTEELIINPRSIKNPNVLSYSQEQMWIIYNLTPGISAYNVPLAFSIKGNLIVKKLEECFNEIIKRHEILRTTFETKDHQPVQIVHDFLRIDFNIVDLSDLNDNQQEDQLNSLASEEAIKPFNLSKLPLVRVTLYKLNDYEYVIVIIQHHIICDGWSIGLMLKELSNLYGNQDNKLPNLPVQFADFALWSRKKFLDGAYEKQLLYWQNILKGELPVLELPTDNKRPPVQSYHGSHERFYINGDIYNRMQVLAKRENCSFFMLTFTCYNLLLYRYSNQQDIIIGFPLAIRFWKEIQNSIGLFLNMIPLRINISDEPTFIELLTKVKQSIVEAYSNCEVPFEKILETLRFKRDASRNSIFQTMIDLIPDSNLSLADLTLSDFDFETSLSQFDLSLFLYEKENSYKAYFEYNTDLFERSTIKRLILNFLQLLESAVENPEEKVSRLKILAAAEEDKITNSLNNTEVEYPKEISIIDLFEEQVKKCELKIAVRSAEKTLSYRELNEKANQLARYLQEKGVNQEDCVGICIERSVEMLVGMLAILKCGAAYVPIDPMFPAERINYMIQDAEVKVIITNSGLAESFNKYKGQLIFIDRERGKIEKEDRGNPGIRIRGNNLAYVIFTSGSTGRPKGVEIEHGSVVNFLLSMQKRPGIKAEDIFISVTTISFDISVLELFLPIITGAELVIAPRDVATDGRLLRKALEERKITMMQATPPTWRMLIDAGWESKSELTILCGGEALPIDLAKQLLYRGKTLWNMYGPTETTVWSTVKKITDSDNVTIGRPINNTSVYILDTYLKPVPIGVIGELYIGGDGLARGYLNRTELNEESFIQNRVNGVTRIYKTGDLARYRSDGEIECLGRIDNQVKIRGYRIELGEIETVLATYPEISDVVVNVWEDSSGDKKLAAYYVPSNDAVLEISKLRSFLSKKLPEYMIPSYFIKMDRFPLTPNAKIDRKKLPPPDISEVSYEEKFIAPTDELELQLAEIWKRVLKIKSAGINDNFFELGGHSLLVIQLFKQIEEEMNIELSIATIFESPTISQLASKILEVIENRN